MEIPTMMMYHFRYIDEWTIIFNSEEHSLEQVADYVQKLGNYYTSESDFIRALDKEDDIVVVPKRKAELMKEWNATVSKAIESSQEKYEEMEM